MKKTLIISCFMALCAAADESTKEILTLKSDSIVSETFTETTAGNGMFYSDKNGYAFLGAGSVEAPYNITQKDDRDSNTEGISLSANSNATVSVGTFTGESHLSIGSDTQQINVYTENCMFIGGFGWYDSTGDWHQNATLTSNKADELTFAAHAGSVTVYTGSKLEVGTGLSSSKDAVSAQLYVGHGAQGTLTVDGGNVISHAHLIVSGTTDAKNTNNSGLLDIKNGGKVTITAEPDKMNASGNETYSYNQLLVGNDNADGSTGAVIIDGNGSELTLESSAAKGLDGNPFYTYATIGRNGGTGEITVTNQGKLTIGTDSAATTFTYIGYGADAQGILTVQNAAAADIKGSIYAGANGGDATINIATNGVLHHTDGAFFIGYNTGSGSVNVKENGTLITQDINIGYNNGQQSSLNVSQGGTANTNNVYMTAANNATATNSITNNGTMNVGGYLNVAAYNQVTNSGDLNIVGNTWIQENANLTNSGTITSESFISLFNGSNVSNTGTIQAKQIILDANKQLTNDGTITATSTEANGIQLGKDAAIRNNGTLSGNVTGNGVIDGNGNMAAVTIGDSTKLVVGETITGLQVTKSITLGSGSTTVFNIAGLDLAEVGSNDGWDSDTHSVIRVDNDAKAAVENDAAFELIFGGDEIWNDMTMEGDTIIWDFTLTLIDGGVAVGSIDLEALLNNTTFSITTDPTGVPSYFKNINVTNAHYEITADGALILTGSLSVPEPTTATLSLLALASLAARRRRK